MAQVFSYEFCETFKNTLFTERLLTTASEYWACMLSNYTRDKSDFEFGKFLNKNNIEKCDFSPPTNTWFPKNDK